MFWTISEITQKGMITVDTIREIREDLSALASDGEWTVQNGHLFARGVRIFTRQQARAYGGGDSSLFQDHCEKRAQFVAKSFKRLTELCDENEALRRINKQIHEEREEVTHAASHVIQSLEHDLEEAKAETLKLKERNSTFREYAKRIETELMEKELLVESLRSELRRLKQDNYIDLMESARQHIKIEAVYLGPEQKDAQCDSHQVESDRAASQKYMHNSNNGWSFE